jgi:MscS family membrane protein
LPSNQRSKQGAALAQQLGQLLESDTGFDEASLSKNPDSGQREPVASFNTDGTKYELQLERVTLRSGVSIWVFTPESVALIPHLARLTSDSPIEKYLPAPLVSWKLVDTSLWQWIALALLVVVLWALSRWICAAFLWWAARMTKRLAPRGSPVFLNELMGPLRLLLVSLAFHAGMEWIGPAPLLRKYLDHTVSLLFFASIAWFCIQIVDVGIRHLRRVLYSSHQTFAYSVLPLGSRILKVSIVVLAGITVLSTWGYNTTTILAGLGVGGLAVALAAQKTIENLIGGVAVITDRPVMVGDFCKVGDRSGTVEDIGLRSTRIRTPERTVLTIPNGAFSGMTLENFSRKDKTWFHMMLNLRRDTTPEQVRELLKSLPRILNQTPKAEAGNHPVRFAGVGTYSLDLDIGTYIVTTDDDEFASIQEELLLKILDAVEAAGRVPGWRCRRRRTMP